MKKTLYVSLLTLMLLTTSVILIIQPWRDITVVSTYSSSSTNDISTYITITANEFFIVNMEEFSDYLSELYETNSLPELMLSDEHYTKDSSVIFLVHTNRISRFLEFDYLEIQL